MHKVVKNCSTLARLLPWILGLLVIIPATIPLYQPGLFEAHDYTHVARLAELDRTVRAGHFPPRWAENFGFGYGMPLFSFYAPLPYYVGLLFHWVGASYLLSIKLLFWTTFYASFMVMYFLARSYTKPAYAYLAAGMFIYVPYRAVDVYVRGALGELWGIIFIALGLFCFSKLLSSKHMHRGWIAASSFTISGLVLSHNLMMMMGIPLLLIFGLGQILMYGKNDWKSLFCRLMISFILGVGMAAYFIGPAILEKGSTSVDRLTQEGGEYSHHFVYLRQFIDSPFGYGGSIEGIHDGISFEIGKVHLGLLAIGIIFLLFRLPLTKQQQYGLGFGITGSMAAFYLMSFHSEWLWRIVPFIDYFQFPWRFLVIPMILIPLVAAIVFDHGTKRLGNLGRFIVIGVVAAALLLLNGKLFSPSTTAYDKPELFSSDATYVQEVMSRVIPDYIHPTLSHIIFRDDYVINPPKDRIEVFGQARIVETPRNDPESISVVVEAEDTFNVRANIFDFPGWVWTVDGIPIEHSVGKDLPIMEMAVVAESEQSILIEGNLNNTLIRQVANIISLTSFILVLWIGLSGKGLCRYRLKK